MTVSLIVEPNKELTNWMHSATVTASLTVDHIIRNKPTVRTQHSAAVTANLTVTSAERISPTALSSSHSKYNC